MISKKIFFPVLILVSTSLFSQESTSEDFKRGFFALTRAAENDYADVKTYLDAGGDIDFQDDLGIGFLHVAATQGNEKEVQNLLARGANPDLRTRFGITPLHIACSVPTSLNVLRFNPWMKSAPAIVKDLLEAGANPNSRNDIGVTPLHLCSSMISTDQDMKNLGIVMPKKIQVGEINTVLGYFTLGTSIAALGPLVYFWGPAAAAAIAALGATTTAGLVGLAIGAVAAADLIRRVIIQVRSKMKRINLLLEHGAHIDAVDNFGNTPLHYFASGKLKDVGLRGRRGSLIIANRFRNENANLTVRNDKGYTAYDLAKMNNRYLLLPLLDPENLGTRITEKFKDVGETVRDVGKDVGKKVKRSAKKIKSKARSTTDHAKDEVRERLPWR